MRRLVVNTLALAVALAGAGIGLGQQQPGQQPPSEGQSQPDPSSTPGPGTPSSTQPTKDKTQPSKSKLEEMLAEALKNNPDIRVAAAKVTEAEAELNRTRLQVTQKVVALYYSLDTQKKTVEHQEAKFKRMQQLFKSATVSSEEMEEAKQALALAKARLAELEAQIPALLGKTVRADDAPEAESVRRALEWLKKQQPSNTYSLTMRIDDVPKTTGPMTDKIRKALETPITVNYKDVKFSEILKDLEKKAPGLSFHMRDLPTRELGADEAKGTLHFDMPLPIAAILQAIEDDTGAHFIVRDYGILVTTGKLPPGALTVQDFMRQKPSDVAILQNPPPFEDIEGTIKQVDPSGLMTISIGSNAGLSKGHTLELFRPGEKPSESKYLGTVRILEAGPKEAVAQPVGRLTTRPKAGDKVASRIREK